MNKDFFRHQVLEAFKQILIFLLCLLFAAVLTQLLSSCTPQRIVQEVPVEVPKYIHDTLRIKVREKETIFVKDSTAQQGDTIHHYRDRWHERILHDTIYQVRHDTIGVPVTVTNTATIEKEKPLAWWQSGMMCVGMVAMLFLLGWVVLAALRAKLSVSA